MKRFLSSGAWFIAGAVFGQLADGVLFRLWSNAGMFMPIGHWLESHGGEIMVKCWSMLWINATSWFLAAMAGILAGVFVRREVLRYLLTFGIGFAFVPIALDGYLYSEVPGFSLIRGHVVSFALVVMCGLLLRRWRHSPNQPLHAPAAPPGS